MKTTHKKSLLAAALACALAFTTTIAQAQDPLPSWNDTAPKQSIVAFVERVTKEGSPDFVPPKERITTFDNDGTLWCEQPMYFQFLFAFDRVKVLAPKHPEWKTKEPFARKFLLAPSDARFGRLFSVGRYGVFPSVSRQPKSSNFARRM